MKNKKFNLSFCENCADKAMKLFLLSKTYKGTLSKICKLALDELMECKEMNVTHNGMIAILEGTLKEINSEGGNIMEAEKFLIIKPVEVDGGRISYIVEGELINKFNEIMESMKKLNDQIEYLIHKSNGR